MEVRQALDELAAAKEREYLAEEADLEAASGYYSALDAEADAPALFTALSSLLEETHRVRPAYRPSVELYPWIDLQPDGKLRSVYTGEEFEPEELIQEAAEVEDRRASLRAEKSRERGTTAESTEALVEDLHPYNCEHVVCQSWFEHHEPMRGDLHHLFTCESKCNSFRGNFKYFDFADFEKVVREDCGKREETGFEPWREKATVARATLYFMLRYPGARHLLGREPGHAPEVARNRTGERVRAPSQRGDLREAGEPEPADRSPRVGAPDRVLRRPLARAIKASYTPAVGYTGAGVQKPSEGRQE